MWAKCEICGRYDHCDTHHVFEGLRRKTSDRLGITVELCQRCHDEVHKHPKQYKWLKAQKQKAYMETHDMTLEQWLEVMHKNYIGEHE